MIKEYKEKWLKALRSGEFEQGTEWLENDGKYCCLGVIRKIIDSNSGLSAYDEEFLHPDHEKICGLNYAQQIELAKMNDSGKTFEEIADYIEKEM